MLTPTQEQTPKWQFDFYNNFTAFTYDKDGEAENTTLKAIEFINTLLEEQKKEHIQNIEEILKACQEDVNFGAEHQQIVSTKGQAKCLEIIQSHK